MAAVTAASSPTPASRTVRRRTSTETRGTTCDGSGLRRTLAREAGDAVGDLDIEAAEAVTTAAIPAAGIASVTSAIWPGPTRSKTAATVSGARCTPSATSSTTASPRAAAASAAATGPGARECSTGIPLNRCVAAARPRVLSCCRGERGPRCPRVAVGVTDTGHDAAGDGVGGESGRARKLGGVGQGAHVAASGVEQPVEQREIGVAEGRGVLGACPGGREERPLQVDTGSGAGLHEARADVQRGEQLGLRGGDQARHERRRAVGTMVRSGRPGPPGSASGKPKPAAPWQCTSTRPGRIVPSTSTAAGQPVAVDPLPRVPHPGDARIVDRHDSIGEDRFRCHEPPAQDVTARPVTRHSRRRARRAQHRCTPAREPSCAATTGGAASRPAARSSLERTGASRASPAPANPPPRTIREGASRARTISSASARASAASCHTSSATGSKPRRVDTSTAPSTGRPLRAA